MPEQPTVLLDANLLTLWIVGQVSEALVPVSRRTRRYSIEDYRLLIGHLSQFSHMIITPHIATETSNLLGSLSGKHLHMARAILAAGLSMWNELYTPSAQVSKEPEFNRLGLTDAAILISATRAVEVFTDDLDLYLALARRRVPVTNFTHLRTANLL